LQTISIESHTINHPILPNCSNDDAESEIQNSKHLLENILGRQVKGFAYPNGSYSMREIAYLKKHGYKYAFTTKPDYLNPSKIKCHYSLPRFEVFDGVSFEENICRMSGVWFRKTAR
jgi:peptidoglycan/xylan/chitin deacetylase (PgdA/CDA1 family)